MIRNILGHLKTVLMHKWWVFYYCCQVGLIWRGLVHDLSKFSPTEFWESVKYYDGGKGSPINKCKQANGGVSRAWLHHRGRNTHHYEYWTDNYDNETFSRIRMPKDDFLEMICDYMAAGRTYMGKNFSFQAEYDWWQNIKAPTCNAMNEYTKRRVDMALGLAIQHKNLKFLKNWNRYNG